VTPFDQAQLQRVPLFISVPGMQGGTNSVYGGDIDVRPTVMHLLGIDSRDYVQFGSDLFSKQHRQIVPFRNGDVITAEYTILGDKTYSNLSGEEVEADKARQSEQIAKKELEFSDAVIYGDLLRFYQPPGFVPPDKKKIDYNTDQTTPPDKSDTPESGSSNQD
jgi:lipoteichoic acid synthase